MNFQQDIISGSGPKDSALENSSSLMQASMLLVDFNSIFIYICVPVADVRFL